MSVRSFIDHHYRHFNAAALKDAAQGYEKHLAGGGKMMVTLAGAMSTAELGLSLGRDDPSGQGSRHRLHRRQSRRRRLQPRRARSTTSAFQTTATSLRTDEQVLLDKHLNRVTDTCIPEEEAMRRIENIRA
jgi:deoxyhypusine synthase